ncbi:formyltransferase family protein [Alphaproteobacteria bacterium]|nr:formyltransferase family protein [Alphaproteobacteria bacterium]
MDQLNKIRICFLISGYGTNLHKVLDNLKKGKNKKFLPSIIISNNNINDNIKTKSKKIYNKIKIYENVKVLNTVNFTNTDLIFSIGYMKKIPKIILNKYKTINLHPSLLPSYKGLMTHKRMILNNEKMYGFSIHLVNEFLDDGKILYQKSKSFNNLSEGSLNKAHKKLEHDYVYKALLKICLMLNKL